MPIPDHPSIEAWVERFSEGEHKSFQAHLERACLYVTPTKEVFDRHGLPKDLIWVALVESGFSPRAISPGHAAGMWQFISATGKRFGLKQNQWIDERMNTVKSTHAAAGYFSFLYDEFGSWPLALAAYNAGENCIRKVINRSGLKTFWELTENGALPTKTCDYVAKVLAAVKIIRNPDRYGFYFDYSYVPEYETVPIPGGVSLSWIGKEIGLSESSLKTCNPELRASVTPPGDSLYKLSVPAGKGDVPAMLMERLQWKNSPGRIATRSLTGPKRMHTRRAIACRKSQRRFI
ncbi:MAG: lytic transglycosylase domain-containing protein [Deltaproteobacteria bacterium]|nr:lytic transglycosylase domain-containing protein [Deltaproteobacteria bacterium]